MAISHAAEARVLVRMEINAKLDKIQKRMMDLREESSRAYTEDIEVGRAVEQMQAKRAELHTTINDIFHKTARLEREEAALVKELSEATFADCGRR